MHSIKWAALLSLFWLLLSGYFQPLMLSFGAISVLIVLLVLNRMHAADEEPRLLKSSYRIVLYSGWLLGQIIKSGVQVTKLIWSPSRSLSPSLSKIKIQDVPTQCRVLYANSITLTPGTLSVDLKDDEITVHALQSESIDELKQGEMDKKIAKIWSETK